MKKLGDVRQVSGTPVEADFTNAGGTPLVIDIASGTAYYMDAAGAVQSIAGGGGGGAPSNATYIVQTANATLSAERVLTDTATITWDFGTAGQAKANFVGSAPASGTATLDFGGSASAEVDTASVTVADAGVAAGSEIALSLRYVATADHTADEALITPIHLVAGNISAGVGFDIKGYCPDQAWGKFSVAWVRS